jgi:hypothetical protein
MRWPAQPSGKEGLDLLLVESIADALCCPEILTPQNAVV